MPDTTPTTDDATRETKTPEQLAIELLTTSQRMTHGEADARRLLAQLRRDWEAEQEPPARLVLGTTDQPPVPAGVCTERGAACHTWDWPAPGTVTAAPVDRAAVLREAADAIETAQHQRDDLVNEALGFLDNNTEQQHVGVHRAAAVLRRMADEAQQEPTDADVVEAHEWLRTLVAGADEAQPATDQPDEAHPAEHTWAAELHDPGADEWVPFGSSNVRATALHSLERGRKLAPVWADGTPTQRRLVRATTTYTVEPAADRPDTETEAAK